ncbi:MAG TPA: alpha-hydroxy-acid oxidizing protein, partial [Burkholderiales bacterium]|nr:alpha-hydroxy-acid oxidizing protein [Burkholderiales bacterium]
VMVDSGFRRGSDIVKGLCLGAHAVWIGRATLYGVAAGGETGARRAIAILREEIDRVMALIGARNIAELTPEFLHFTNAQVRRLGHGRAELKVLETPSRTAAEH